MGTYFFGGQVRLFENSFCPIKAMSLSFQGICPGSAATQQRASPFAVTALNPLEGISLSTGFLFCVILPYASFLRPLFFYLFLNHAAWGGGWGAKSRDFGDREFQPQVLAT